MGDESFYKTCLLKFFDFSTHFREELTFVFNMPIYCDTLTLSLSTSIFPSPFPLSTTPTPSPLPPPTNPLNPYHSYSTTRFNYKFLNQCIKYKFYFFCGNGLRNNNSKRHVYRKCDPPATSFPRYGDRINRLPIINNINK